MIKIWKNSGIDRILKEAVDAGVILSGVSAGAICWFKYGLSDSRKFKNPNADYIKVSGLGWMNTLYCPHYDAEPQRKTGLKKMMKKTPGSAVAIENCCAVEIIDDKYRIISSKGSARAYKVFWKKSKFYQEVIKQEKDFRSLSEILNK
jgi:dipeptidase E